MITVSAAVLFLGVLGIVGLTFYKSYYYLNFSRHKPYINTPADYGLEFIKSEFPSRQDQINISAWFIPSEIGVGQEKFHQSTIIIVHGHGSNMGRNEPTDFIRDVVMPLHKAGFSTFLLDLRNHGSSADSLPMSMGIEESRDILGAIDHLKEKSEEWNVDSSKIGVWGSSLGGATTLYAVAKDHENNPKHIRAAFIDSAFSNSLGPIYLRLKNDGVPSILHDMIIFWLRIIPKFDIAKYNPIENIPKIKAPIFFLHAAQDITVDPSDSKSMYKACIKAQLKSRCTLWISDATKHVATSAEYPEQYHKNLVDFFQKHM